MAFSPERHVVQYQLDEHGLTFDTRELQSKLQPYKGVIVCELPISVTEDIAANIYNNTFTRNLPPSVSVVYGICGYDAPDLSPDNDFDSSNHEITTARQVLPKGLIPLFEVLDQEWLNRFNHQESYSNVYVAVYDMKLSVETIHMMKDYKQNIVEKLIERRGRAAFREYRIMVHMIGADLRHQCSQFNQHLDQFGQHISDVELHHILMVHPNMEPYITHYLQLGNTFQLGFPISLEEQVVMQAMSLQFDQNTAQMQESYKNEVYRIIISHFDQRMIETYGIPMSHIEEVIQKYVIQSERWHVFWYDFQKIGLIEAYNKHIKPLLMKIS